MRKKVLFIMPAMVGGGAEKVLIDILRNFDYKRYDVSLFLEYRDGLYVDDIPSEVNVMALHGKNNLWFQRFHRRLLNHQWLVAYYYWVYRLMFLWVLRHKKFDIAISFMEGSAVRFHSYMFHKAEKHLSWVHIDLFRKHWSLDYFKGETEEAFIYKLMNKVIFVSNDARSSFLKMFPLVDSTRCLVQYNLIDVENIQRLANTSKVVKKKITICMAGRLNPQKRYDRALEVARRLNEEGYDFELWILGDGELRPMIEKKIHEYDLNQRVLMMGFVKPPYSYMAQADILLCTSESEGLPLVIAEAFCLGVPVVATNITGPLELIGNSEYGILVEENTESIYQAVKSLLTNRHLRMFYAERSLERAKIFGVEKFMQDFYNLLEE